MLISLRIKTHGKAADRVRGCDPQRAAVPWIRFRGADRGVIEWKCGLAAAGEGVSHFLSEMSCGEVVAGSLLFPGRAFEFSSPGFFFLVSTPLLGCSCGTLDMLPLEGAAGQWIRSGRPHVLLGYGGGQLVLEQQTCGGLFESKLSGQSANDGARVAPTGHAQCKPFFSQYVVCKRKIHVNNKSP